MSEELEEALSVAESNIKSLEAALRNKDELLAQTRIVRDQYLRDYNEKIDRIDELEKENGDYEAALEGMSGIMRMDFERYVSERCGCDVVKLPIDELARRLSEFYVDYPDNAAGS